MYTCKKPENFHQYFGVENGYYVFKKIHNLNILVVKISMHFIGYWKHKYRDYIHFILQTMQSIQKNLQRLSLLLILVKKVRNLFGVVTLALPIFNNLTYYFQLPLQKLLIIIIVLVLQNQKKLHLMSNVNLCSMHLTLVKKYCYKLQAHFRDWKVKKN